MNSASQVDSLIAELKQQSIKKAETVVRIAEACLGWPYVWGGYGQYCTVSNRQSYANRSTCPSGESAEIINRCQVLGGGKSSCSGCKFYPGSVVRFFDCRGFTRWVLKQVGFTLNGAGATSQWNTNDNWERKGEISELPAGVVCCVFMQNSKDHKTMEHTGIYIGGGQIIHCSGTVKYGKITDRGWTHFAIPKGLDNGDIPTPVWRPTLRKGSSGEDVKYLQKKLIDLGYNLGSYGADGKFGNMTEAAVKAFQKSVGLDPDGVVGPLTWEMLEKTDIPEKKYYTVTIEHLEYSQAEDIKKKFPEAKIDEEVIGNG